MWIANEKGFFSVVLNYDSIHRKDELIVRARKKVDLMNLFPKKRVIISTDKDYAYRVFASKKEVAKVMYEGVMDISYSNFKNHIKSVKNQKDKLPFYDEIWGIMNDYQSKFIQGLYNFKLPFSKWGRLYR